ncbi:endonuclease, partial [Enterobacter hormaechei]|nr:endonuclease [Enterobacter hormaechei]
NPDIVCINELETGTSRMGKEKLTELASRLDMYPYFIMSYPKDVGFYGNGILSKYPIVSSFSALHPYKHAKGEGNYQCSTGYEYYLYGYDQRSMGYIDILVPTSDSDGQIVRIICTHFDHCGIDQVIQQQEQNVVTQAGLNNPEYPTILMGDLNVGWGTNVLPEFRNLGDHIGVSWVDHIFAFPKGRWTGHDFKSHSCPAANGKASLSDHNPITATLVLK